MIEDRSAMCFKKLAIQALDFLEQEHGFTCSHASDLRIKFQSSKVFIEMGHGLRDCEVFIRFGRVDRPESFCFTLFLKLVNPLHEARTGNRMADKPDAIAATVKSLVNVLRSEGQGIIGGDDAVFDRMKDVRWWGFFPEALAK